MPFKIIRNDITKVKADAIVNTANPAPIYSSGTDSAIYEAAGAEQLLARRQEIGRIERGEVVVTDAFALPARFILHTVGPIWMDGQSGEFDVLRSCYMNCLYKALELGCENIAFPLISTGVYGFPKDRALEIAISSFSRFLTENEMEIILVVFDKQSYQLSEGIVGDIDSYIDSNYVAQTEDKEYPSVSYGTQFDSETYERARIGSISQGPSAIGVPELVRRVVTRGEKTATSGDSTSYTRASETIGSTPITHTGSGVIGASGEANVDGELNGTGTPGTGSAHSIEDALADMGMTFQEKLFELIGSAGLDNKDVWKRANMDRKLFSKIQCDVNYHPRKKTVLALCIALELDMEQSRDLMARADWAFSPSSKLDLIVQKAIMDQKYDIYELNMVLFQYTNETLGN